MRTLLVLSLLFPLLSQDEKTEKGTAPCRALRPAADPALRDLLKLYEFADRDFPWQLRETRQNDKYTQYWLSFPSAVKTEVPENNTVWCRFWQPMILPPLILTHPKQIRRVFLVRPKK